MPRLTYRDVEAIRLHAEEKARQEQQQMRDMAGG